MQKIWKNILKYLDYKIAEYVHIELGKIIYYDNNYTSQLNNRKEETSISKVRKNTMLKLSTNKSSNAQINISISNRREVEVDMEKCKKRNMKHCTKSKFCAKRSRTKYIELKLESFLVFSVHSDLLCLTNTLLLYLYYLYYAIPNQCFIINSQNQF